MGGTEATGEMVEVLTPPSTEAELEAERVKAVYLIWLLNPVPELPVRLMPEPLDRVEQVSQITGPMARLGWLALPPSS